MSNFRVKVTTAGLKDQARKEKFLDVSELAQVAESSVRINHWPYCSRRNFCKILRRHHFSPRSYKVNDTDLYQ